MDLNETDLKVISFLNKLYYLASIILFLYRAVKLYGNEWKVYILQLLSIILILFLLKKIINIVVKGYFARDMINRF